MHRFREGEDHQDAVLRFREQMRRASLPFVAINGRNGGRWRDKFHVYSVPG
jgi:hypothetical protein